MLNVTSVPGPVLRLTRIHSFNPLHQTFPVKVQIINILGLASLIAITQLCCSSAEAAMDRARKSGHRQAPIKHRQRPGPRAPPYRDTKADGYGSRFTDGKVEAHTTPATHRRLWLGRGRAGLLSYATHPLSCHLSPRSGAQCQPMNCPRVTAGGPGSGPWLLAATGTVTDWAAGIAQYPKLKFSGCQAYVGSALPLL